MASRPPADRAPWPRGVTTSFEIKTAYGLKSFSLRKKGEEDTMIEWVRHIECQRRVVITHPIIPTGNPIEGLFTLKSTSNTFQVLF
jgi:hypothetical protein